jgi:hypothetical protein
MHACLSVDLTIFASLGVTFTACGFRIVYSSCERAGKGEGPAGNRVKSTAILALSTIAAKHGELLAQFVQYYCTHTNVFCVLFICVVNQVRFSPLLSEDVLRGLVLGAVGSKQLRFLRYHLQQLKPGKGISYPHSQCGHLALAELLSEVSFCNTNFQVHKLAAP